MEESSPSVKREGLTNGHKRDTNQAVHPFNREVGMQRPWVRSLFAFVVSLIGFESITGLVWLFISSDKLLEICLYGGVIGATWIAYRVHDQATQEQPAVDPLDMSDTERRQHLRQVRNQIDKRS